LSAINGVYCSHDYGASQNSTMWLASSKGSNRDSAGTRSY